MIPPPDTRRNGSLTELPAPLKEGARLNTFSAPADSASQRNFLSYFRDVEWLTEAPIRNTLTGHAERLYDYLLRKMPGA
jgi:hypothetical protein